MGIDVWTIDKLLQANHVRGQEIFLSSFGWIMAPFWCQTNNGGII